VEALNTGTGVGSQTTTDDRGVYRFVNIQTGVYRITVGAASFKTIVESNVIVNANEVRRVDFPMQIAVTNEKIEVSARLPCCRPTKRMCTRRSPPRR